MYRYEFDGNFYYFEHRLHKGEKLFGEDFGFGTGIFDVRYTIRKEDDDGVYWQLFLD